MSVYVLNNKSNEATMLADSIPIGILEGGDYAGEFTVEESPEEEDFQKILDSLAPGDILVTSTLVNYSHDFMKALSRASILSSNGIRVVAIAEGLDTQSESSKRFLNEVRTAHGIFKRNVHAARDHARKVGIKRASAAGKYKKSRPLRLSEFEDFVNFYDKYMHRELTKRQFACGLGISRPTLNRLIEEYEAEKRS